MFTGFDAMNDCIFYQRLKDQPGNDELPTGFRTINFVVQPFAEAQLLKLQIIFQKTAFFPNGRKMFFFQDIAQQVSQAVKSVIQFLCFPNLIQGNKAVNCIDQKMRLNL